MQLQRDFLARSLCTAQARGDSRYWVHLRLHLHVELGDHISRRADSPLAGGRVLVVGAARHAQVHAAPDAAHLRLRAATHPPAVLVLPAAARARCGRQLPQRRRQRGAAHLRRPPRQPDARRRLHFHPSHAGRDHVRATG